MKATKMDHPNNAIHCIVNTCHYYMQGDHCSADHIDVEPKNANDTQDTDCGTFTLKSNR